MSKFASKPKVTDAQGGTAPVGMADKKKFPTLIEYLTRTSYDDGSPRQTSTVMVFIDQGHVKACLNDRDAGRAGWMSADALGSVLDELERALADDSIDWRASRGDNKRGRR